MRTKNKDKELNHRHFIGLRLTDVELDLLDQGATCLSISRSEYLRKLLLEKQINHQIEVVADMNDLRKLVSEYGKIGSNLNQIAKHFNSGGSQSHAIGVFDGGTDSTLPHLKDFVTAHELTPITGHPALIAHGTAVCGAVLYGLLNYKSSTEQLETPIVSVDSYRVLPQQQTGNPIEDSGLYPAIDQIEQIVHNHTETALYNLSFGPRGAIVDDDISRFTYALDRLSMLPHHPLFCVAVGNDGDLPYPFNRIQAPADLVNGLGIGAYTFDRNGEKARASYSCIGPGREGCKVKPDVLEFGGSPENPAVLISTIPNKATVECGTSFSSPIVTGKLGKMMALSSEISQHMAKTLLIAYSAAAKPPVRKNRNHLSG